MLHVVFKQIFAGKKKKRIFYLLQSYQNKTEDFNLKKSMTIPFDIFGTVVISVVIVLCTLILLVSKILLRKKV